jgi:PEP-CTERM motif
MAKQFTLGSRMKIIKALVLTVLAWSAAPAQAQTVNYSYIGADRAPPVIVAGQGTLISVTEGIGAFSFNQTSPTQSLGAPGSVKSAASVIFGLKDLRDFSFESSTIRTFSDFNPAGFPAVSFFKFGRSDVLSFSATFAGNVLTRLSFATRAVAPTGAQIGAQSFRVTGLGADQAATFDGRGLQLTSGNFDAAAVPEPATWALMIIGFGMVGASLRTRRRIAIA